MYNQGDLLIVPFPFSDLSSIKRRPVLVLSKNEDNKKSEDLIVCGLTSRLEKSKYSIVIDSNDLRAGNIPIRSKIRVDKIFTIDKRIVIKNVASLKEDVFKRVEKEFLNLI